LAGCAGLLWASSDGVTQDAPRTQQSAQLHLNQPTSNPSASIPLVDWSNTHLCQALGPAAPHPIWGVDSTAGCGMGEVTWQARGDVNWQAYAQGEYVGHARSAHVGEYRIRVDD